MVGKRKQDPDEDPRVLAENEPGEQTNVVSDPDADPGPGDNPADQQSNAAGVLPNEPEYTGPGTFVPRSERLDWPENSVCYTGSYGAREITAQQFENAGCSDQPSMRWDESNGHAIPKSAFTEAALRLVQQTGEFKIT